MPTRNKKGCNNSKTQNPIHIRATPKEVEKKWAAFPQEIRKIEDQQQQKHQEK
jgi:hypothetical protein